MTRVVSMNGNFSFRYRNRIRLEREFRVYGRSLTPYGSVEVYHDSRFDVWNRNRFTGEAEFQLNVVCPRCASWLRASK